MKIEIYVDDELLARLIRGDYDGFKLNQAAIRITKKGRKTLITRLKNYLGGPR